MKMTNAFANALIVHIEELSREEQVDSLRNAIRPFKVNVAKLQVRKALSERKADISDMRESHREMP
jgi:hypothetical protein